MKVIINDKVYDLPKEVADLVLEAQTFRVIGEGRSPKDLLEYIRELHKKYYELLEKNK